MSLIGLFFLFMYIGFCTIGGGLVAITLLQQELIPRGLIRSEDFFAMVAISESTPGPMGINMATYIGYELYGVLGSVVLTTGIVLPSLVVIVLIARFASSFQEKPLVKKSFYGLRAGAVGMITVACWQVINISILNLSVFKESGKITDIVHIKQFGFFWLLFFVAAGAIFGVLFL